MKWWHCWPLKCHVQLCDRFDGVAVHGVAEGSRVQQQKGLKLGGRPASGAKLLTCHEGLKVKSRLADPQLPYLLSEVQWLLGDLYVTF